MKKEPLKIETEKNEKRFRALVENNEGIISLVDAKLNVLFRSASAARITGWKHGENEKISAVGYLHPDDEAQVRTLMAESLKNPGKAIPLATRVKHANGNYIWLEGVITNMLDDPDIGGLVINLRDVTEKITAQQKILKISRLYSFISQINQMIVRTADEYALFREACNIAVGIGKFRMAWIGIINAATKKVVAVMHAGEDDDYLSRITDISIADVPEGRGPTGTALREGRYIVCNDIEKDPHMAPWKEAAAGKGYLSSMAIPIKKSGKVIGAFSFYASEKNFFDADEIALLEEATGDISFALGVFEKEAQRRNAEEAVLNSERHYQALAEVSPVGIFHTDEKGYTTYVNPRWCIISGLSREESLGNGWLKAVYEDDKESLAAGWQKATKVGEVSFSEYRFLHPDGTKVWVMGQAIPEKNTEGKIIGYVGTITDITERKKAEEEIIRERDLSDAIINSLPGIFYLYNRDGKFLRWNKNFETFSGYSAAEVSNMNPLDFFDEDEKVLLAEKINNTFVAGEENVQANFFLKSKLKVPYYFTGKAINYAGESCLLGVGIDFSERVKAQELVRQSSEQLRRLTAHLQNVREEERRRIGREIHDDLGQQLTAIKMDVAWIDKKIPAENSMLKTKLKNVIALLDGGNHSVRRILNELRPLILDNYGLIEALNWQGRQFTSNTGIVIECVIGEIPLKLAEEISTCIFRVYQEALTNITRYAKAHKVQASLNTLADSIILYIEDDGEGFDPVAVDEKKTFGILGMKERVLALNGKFDLVTAPGKGTKIFITIPLQGEHSNPTR